MSNEEVNSNSTITAAITSSSSSPSSIRAQRFKDLFHSSNANSPIETSSTTSIPSSSIHSKDTSLESNSSSTSGGKFVDNISSTTPKSIKSIGIVSNGLPISRIALGERRRTYEDEFNKSTSISTGGGGITSDSEGSSTNTSAGRKKSVNESLSGIRKRASSVELRNNYNTSDKNQYAEEGQFTSSIKSESSPVRPSYSSAPNSTLDKSTYRSSINSGLNPSNNQSSSVPMASTSSTLYSSQPHLSRALDSNSYDMSEISYPIQHPSAGPYQSPSNYYSPKLLGPVAPPLMLSPINTNVNLSIPLPPPPPPFYQQPSPKISPFSFPPPLTHSNSYPSNPYSTLYPLPLQSEYSQASPLTPSALVAPSEEILALGEVSPLISTTGGEEGIESADIVYGSDGEPSTDKFGIVEKGEIVGNAVGIGLTNFEQPQYFRGDQSSINQQAYNIPPPPPPIQTSRFPISPYFSPPLNPQHPTAPNFYPGHQQQQFSNSPYQYHQLYQNFSPPYPSPFQMPQGGNDFNNRQPPQSNFGMNSFEGMNSYMPYHPQQQLPQQYPSTSNAYSQYSPLSQQGSSPQLTFLPQSQFSQFSPTMNQLLPYPHPSNHAIQMHQQQLHQQQQQQQQNQGNPHLQQYPIQNQNQNQNEPYRFHPNSQIPLHSQQSSSQSHQQNPHQQQTQNQNQHHHQQQQPQNCNSSNPTPNSNAPYSTPQIYSPPPEGLVRGGLAQAKFYEEVYGRDGVYSAQNQNMSAGIGLGNMKRLTGLGRGLPRPPVHSNFALWVGNVPSDATHTELWQFFTSRSAPASAPNFVPKTPPMNRSTNVDYSQCGVESIHLIARSNCAFVNYSSDTHLQHSIAVSHGVSLRPQDPRCKDLVCRVRKREDDSKSGVGAQRTGGMHHAYLANFSTPSLNMNPYNNPNLNHNLPKFSTILSGISTRHKNSLEGSLGQMSIASTSSSFLGKYFAKRFFILKSLNEEDLDLSVRTGLWATQTHNEPVLDQAFRSCKEGVYLIFGANKSGEWYGYARMTGSISLVKVDDKFSPASNPSTRQSLNSSNAQSTPYESSPPANQLRPQTIPEDFAADYISPENLITQVNTRIFSPSESRFVEESPQPITPGGASIPSTRSATVTKAAISALRTSSLPNDVEAIADNLHIPPEKRAESLDPELLNHDDSESAQDKPDLKREAGNFNSVPAQLNYIDLGRKDTLPTAEERNAKLETMSEDPELDGSSSSTETKPFEVEWIKVFRLPFHNTRHIKNVFNGGRECKISRDGTEVDPVAGEKLLEEFWKSDGGIPESLKSTTRIVSGSSLSPITRFREMNVIATDTLST